MIQRFTSDPSHIDELTQTMQLSAEDPEHWTKEYTDPTSQEKWLLILVETDYHGGRHPILIKLPEPSQAELISIALHSSSKDEVATAAALLNYNERDLGFGFREELIKLLEERTIQPGFRWTEMKRWRIPTIIQECDLSDGVNRHPIMGKLDSEIDADYQYFQDIATRARTLINSATKG